MKEIYCWLKIRKINNFLLIHDNCIIIHITLTQLITQCLVSLSFFFVFSPQNQSPGPPVECSGTTETGDKNHGLTGATNVLCRKLRKGLCKRFRDFQNRLVYEFYHLKEFVTLEQ